MMQNTNEASKPRSRRRQYMINGFFIILIVLKIVGMAFGDKFESGGKGLLKKSPLSGDFAVVSIGSEKGSATELRLFDLQKGIDYPLIEPDGHDNSYLSMNAIGTKLYFLSSRKTTRDGYASYQLTYALYEYNILTGEISQVRMNIPENDDDNTSFIWYFTLRNDSLHFFTTLFPYITIIKNKYTGESISMDPNDSLDFTSAFFDYKNDRLLDVLYRYPNKVYKNDNLGILEYTPGWTKCKKTYLDRPSFEVTRILYSYMGSDTIVYSTTNDKDSNYLMKADLKTGKTEVLKRIKYMEGLELYDGGRYCYGSFTGDKPPYKDRRCIFRYNIKTDKTDTLKIYSQNNVDIDCFFSR